MAFIHAAAPHAPEILHCIIVLIQPLYSHAAAECLANHHVTDELLPVSVDNIAKPSPNLVTTLPSVLADLWIVVADPLRAGHEISYWPGDVNFRMADIILINKANSAPEV